MTQKLAGTPRCLGHVALRVRDVDAAAEWYADIIGLTPRRKMFGISFLGIREDTSHELALMPLPADAAPPDPTRVGMYHFAWEMDTFEELEQLHARLLAKGVRIGGYSPDPYSANVMFFDPEGNEMEAIWEPTQTQLAALKAAGKEVPKLARAAGF